MIIEPTQGFSFDILLSAVMMPFLLLLFVVLYNLFLYIISGDNSLGPFGILSLIDRLRGELGLSEDEAARLTLVGLPLILENILAALSATNDDDPLDEAVGTGAVVSFFSRLFGGR